MEKRDIFGALGVNPDGTLRPLEPKKYECPRCGEGNAYYREIHPDTSMNDIVLYCPDCGYTEDEEVKTMKKQVKTIPFEIKEVNDEERSFLAVASTEDLDRDNDRILADGWDLSNFMKNPVIPWGHRYGDPPVAQSVETFVKDGKLMIRPKFATYDEYPFADTIYKLYKGGFLRAFSVGFDPKRFEIVEREKGRRGYDFIEQELWEVSACTVPSNPNALIAAKAKGVIDEDEFARAEKLINEKPKTRKFETLEQYVANNTERLQQLAGEGNIMARVLLELDTLDPDEATMQAIDEAVGGLSTHLESAEERTSLDERLKAIEETLKTLTENSNQNSEETLETEEAGEPENPEPEGAASTSAGQAETRSPEEISRGIAEAVADAVSKKIKSCINDRIDYHLGKVK